MVYTHFMNEQAFATRISIETEKSILGMENNFLGVLSFLSKLSIYLFQEHNPTEVKMHPNEDDKKNFHLFTENAFIQLVEEDEGVKKYLKTPTIDWNSDKETLFSLYKEIKQTNFCKLALLGQPDLNRDYEFSKNVYKWLILESVEFEEFMEENNLFWYDEKIPILKSFERFFKDFEDREKVVIPRFSKSLTDDIQMANELIAAYVDNTDFIRNEIDKYTPGWESERIAKIDYILLSMALVEFKFLDGIPVKVTLNEYIEIAKMYSTPKSSKFINGTLDKMLQDWTSQGLINKTGRGLIG